ncbi:hypothetical protein [Alsobacter sp. R-9]
MLRLATLLWALIGTTLAGTFILAVVSVPALYDQGMKLIPWAAAAGVVVAIPVAVLVARSILGAQRPA